LLASDKLYFRKVWAEKTFNETFNDFFNNRVVTGCAAGMRWVMSDSDKYRLNPCKTGIKIAQ